MTAKETDPAVAKILEHRRFVLKEFVDSEREYVERLRVTVEDYLNHIREGGPDVPPTLKMDILSIFSTLPEIYCFHHKVLLPALQEKDLEDAEAMVGVFLKHGSEFTSKYVAYCKNKPVSDSTRLEYDDFFTARQTKLGQKLNIEDLLIAPVQRLPRYQLLIRDLLKDTRKVKMDTSKIEEALELMQRIPKETNSMICMSLLRGIPRGNVISHGSLWRQEALLFATNGSKEETCQVYLFDHQIIVASLADSEGFFHFKLGIKTLNGKLTEGSAGEFQFIEDGGVGFRFRADKKESADNWIRDLQSILTSQLQMRKALIFGKANASPGITRNQSIGMEWSDSDSSIDSMPDSDSDLEGDWPEQTGFVSLDLKKPAVTVSKTKDSKTKENKKKSPMYLRKIGPSKSLKSPSLTLSPSPPIKSRPHSASFADIEQSVLRKSESLSVSPSLLKRLRAMKSVGDKTSLGYIHYPHPSHSLIPPRSPGAQRRVSQSLQISPDKTYYYIAVDNQPAVAKEVYKPSPGQVFHPLDVSRVDVWKVLVLSGANAGEEVWLQRSMIEEYTAPMSLLPVKKTYSVINDLGRGRFSEVRLVRLKSNKKLVAIKILREGTSEESFFRELCINTHLHHDNVVSCQGGIHNGGMTLVLENINGRQLFDYLVRKASVTETMVAGLMDQLLDALHYLHSHTIVHMDIRPSNIMIQITRKGDMVKLIDFGAARHYGDDSLTRQLEPMSEYLYTSPEVLQQSPIGPGCDVWGVGVIVYTIFHSCSPFRGHSNLHTIANITSARYFIPSVQSPACSREAIALIKDIFVLSTRKRPSAEAARSYDWFKKAEEFKQNRVDIGKLKRFMHSEPAS